MGIGDTIGNVVLGGSNQRVYTPQEQAEYSRRYPGLQWRNGTPYTTQGAADDTGYDGPNAQYRGQTGREDQPGSLVEADLNDPNFLSQLARFAAVTSAGQVAAGGLGGGAAAAPSAATSSAAGVPTLGAPALTSLPGMTSGAMTAGGMVPTLGASTLTSLPGMTSGAGAGGGMGFMDILKKIGQISGVAQNIGSVAGGAAQQQADTEQNQALLDTTRNSQLLNQYGTQQGAEMDAGRLDLDRNKFNLDSEGTRMKRALIGALLGQVGSAPQGKFSIGNGAGVASMMQNRATDQVQAGNTYSGGTVLTPPTLSQPKAGSGSGFLNSLALISSMLGAGTAKPPNLSGKQ